jgi:hypothetical protein
MNPSGLSSSVVRVAGRYESCQPRGVPWLLPPLLNRVAADNSAYYRTRVNCDKCDGLDHQSTISGAAVIAALLLLLFLPRARSCRVCDTRVPLFSELQITAANLLREEVRGA